MKAEVVKFMELINSGVDMKEAAVQARITDMTVGDFLDALSACKE
jgi:hypothetical protein